MLRWNSRLTGQPAQGDDQGEYPNAREFAGLAARAKFHGFQIEVDDRGGTFVFEPKTGRRERVTGFSCSCKQWIGSGAAACQHHALVMVEKGLAPELAVA